MVSVSGSVEGPSFLWKLATAGLLLAPMLLFEAAFHPRKNGDLQQRSAHNNDSNVVTAVSMARAAGWITALAVVLSLECLSQSEWTLSASILVSETALLLLSSSTPPCASNILRAPLELAVLNRHGLVPAIAARAGFEVVTNAAPVALRLAASAVVWLPFLVLRAFFFMFSLWSCIAGAAGAGAGAGTGTGTGAGTGRASGAASVISNDAEAMLGRTWLVLYVKSALIRSEQRQPSLGTTLADIVSEVNQAVSVERYEKEKEKERERERERERQRARDRERERELAREWEKGLANKAFAAPRPYVVSASAAAASAAGVGSLLAAPPDVDIAVDNQGLNGPAAAAGVGVDTAVSAGAGAGTAVGGIGGGPQQQAGSYEEGGLLEVDDGDVNCVMQ